MITQITAVSPAGARPVRTWLKFPAGFVSVTVPGPSRIAISGDVGAPSGNLLRGFSADCAYRRRSSAGGMSASAAMRSAPLSAPRSITATPAVACGRTPAAARHPARRLASDQQHEGRPVLPPGALAQADKFDE